MNDDRPRRTGANIRQHQYWPIVVLLLLVSACGQDQGGPDANAPTPTVVLTETSLSAATAAETQPSAATSVPPTPGGGENALVTAEPVADLRANELGQVPILMYHLIGSEPEQFVRTPAQLRADLQWLYDNGFHIVSLNDYLTNSIDIPAGKRPVVLTFDDSSASQFRLLPLADGRLAIDPNSAVGILEAFFVAHPDFGRGGQFGVNARNFFDWDPDSDESDQTQYAALKFQWLIDNGYEIGNHTFDHANLGEIDDEEIKRQLASNDLAIQELVPEIEPSVITLPYGAYPAGGDDTLLRGFEYDGRTFSWDAALLVGANPANSPNSMEFSPYETARIQAFDDELNKWFQIFIDAPTLLYVSDGNPDTVTVPNDLHPMLAGTLDESSLGNRALIRY